MDRLFFIWIPLLITCFSMPLVGMLAEPKLTIDDILTHKDIPSILSKFIHKKDRADMRLVCKQWASKNISCQTRPNWKCMPDNIEKKYDKQRIQKYKCDSLDTTAILFDCTSENDLESIQWIIDNISPKDRCVNFETDIGSRPQCSLYPSMIAIHNRKPEIARLLIEWEHHSRTTSWKSYYDQKSVPEFIKQFLYIGNQRDFSFLLYLNATWADNAKKLKKLYKQKKPTEKGQRFLIGQCLYENAIQCFTFLLTHKSIKEIIRKDCIDYFELAVETYKKEFPQKLLKEKLFYLNGTLGDEPKTILDYYCEKKDTEAIVLLLTLGAKSYNT